jgi:hypothetical protein
MRPVALFSLFVLRIGLAVAGDEQLLKLVYGDRRGGEGEVCKTESTT